MKKLLLIALLAVACTEPGIKNAETDNAKFKVEVLFTTDSITVYRFRDGGRDHYFTKDGTMQTINVGKSYYEENIQ